MNQLATVENKDLIFDPANLTKETIKQFLCPTASDQELMLGLQIAKTFNLNPLKREVYFVKYKDHPMQVLTGYEVYLKRAERSGKYNGLEITSHGTVAAGDLKAVVKVFRKDWTNPLTHEAFYSEYVQMKKDFNTGKLEPNTFWKNKPVTMIKKVAVSQAFRMAFPDEFDGMPYTSDEVVDQERVIDVEPAAPAKNGSTSTSPEKNMAFIDPNEEKVTGEQGQALLNYLKLHNYTKDDLKQFIGDKWGLNSLMEVRNKHLLEIKKRFSIPKDKVTQDLEAHDASFSGK